MIAGQVELMFAAVGNAQAQIKAGHELAFMQAKVITARFYADHLLSKAPGVRDSIVEGAESVTAMALEAF